MWGVLLGGIGGWMGRTRSRTCFGPISGPSSGCDLTYRAAIQDVWGVLLGYWGLGGGNEISLFQ